MNYVFFLRAEYLWRQMKRGLLDDGVDAKGDVFARLM